MDLLSGLIGFVLCFGIFVVLLSDNRIVTVQGGDTEFKVVEYKKVVYTLVPLGR